MDISQRPATQLAAGHVLSRPRISPNYQASPLRPQVLDTTTLAAESWDVDGRSGFMPPEPPVARLPAEWDAWENILQVAIGARFTVGDTPDITPEETDRALQWREAVQNMPMLGTHRLKNSERNLRRAHLVLAWILHFYVHTHVPAPTPIIIPAVLTVPLLAISRELILPPVLTYSDTVLYNWRYAEGDPSKLESVTTFTQTKDEEHFYLTSAYIELAGVEALGLMQRCFDEAFVADEIALRRISSYLRKLAVVIKRMTKILDAVRDACEPKIFFNDVRPWLRGEDSGKRRWIFVDENGEEVDFGDRRELSGPSAGQSSLIHALDIFLGVDHTPPRRPAHPTTTTDQPLSNASGSMHANGASKPTKGFLDRMLAYMPRHHRAFMNHLKVTPRPIRTLVSHHTTGAGSEPSPITNAYDAAVLALKGLRDAHIRIATLYIINQMPRNDTSLAQAAASAATAKGTGGSDLVPFLKGSRDDTTRALINPH